MAPGIPPADRQHQTNTHTQHLEHVCLSVCHLCVSLCVCQCEPTRWHHGGCLPGLRLFLLGQLILTHLGLSSQPLHTHTRMSSVSMSLSVSVRHTDLSVLGRLLAPHGELSAELGAGGTHNGEEGDGGAPEAQVWASGGHGVWEDARHAEELDVVVHHVGKETPADADADGRAAEAALDKDRGEAGAAHTQSRERETISGLVVGWFDVSDLWISESVSQQPVQSSPVLTPTHMGESYPPMQMYMEPHSPHAAGMPINATT